MISKLWIYLIKLMGLFRIDKYLVIITTILVLTQVIRVIQNAVQLRRQTQKMYDIDVIEKDSQNLIKEWTIIINRLSDILENRGTL